MFLIATVCLLGLASAQKVTLLTYCSLDEQHLRLDCTFEPAAGAGATVAGAAGEAGEAGAVEGPNTFCKYTMGNTILDTTDPEETQHVAMKTRARVLLIKGNDCRLRYNHLPHGRSNFTCHVRQGEAVSKMVTVERKLLLPCSALSVLLQNCSPLLLTLMTLHTLLGTH